MAEYGLFLPPEAAYTKPGAWRGAVEAEATKRATYLSQMDQFYAQLEEATRQFEATFGLKEEELELERERFAEAAEQFEATFGLSKEELRLKEEQLELARETLAQEERMGKFAYTWATEQMQMAERPGMLPQVAVSGGPLPWHMPATAPTAPGPADVTGAAKEEPYEYPWMTREV